MVASEYMGFCSLLEGSVNDEKKGLAQQDHNGLACREDEVVCITGG